MDYAVAGITALPGVAAAVAGRAPVLMDGGIRRGTDLLKALAHGAQAVLLGRPVLWGLASGGEAGARQVFKLLRDALSVAMALAGCPDLKSITPDLIAR
ncbi:MAG: alpha-hydroxy-acid oxidizing protein [Thermoflexales bacterium]